MTGKTACTIYSALGLAGAVLGRKRRMGTSVRAKGLKNLRVKIECRNYEFRTLTRILNSLANS